LAAVVSILRFRWVTLLDLSVRQSRRDCGLVDGCNASVRKANLTRLRGARALQQSDEVRGIRETVKNGKRSKRQKCFNHRVDGRTRRTDRGRTAGSVAPATALGCF